MISILAEQVGGNCLCDICNFESNWANGLCVSRKHKQIEQLDGGSSVSDEPDNDDDKDYSVLGTFLDVLDVIWVGFLRVSCHPR